MICFSDFIKSSWLKASVLTLLAGCMLGPEYNRPESYGLTSAAFTSTSTLEEQQHTGVRWWENYNDPVLNDWVAQLAAENLDLKAIAERTIQAQERVAIQRGALWPAIGISGEGARSFFPNPVESSSRSYATDVNVGAGISWQVDLFGRTRSAVEAAEYGALASATDYQALLHVLIAELVSQRAGLSVLRREIQIQEDIVGNRTQTLNTVSRRYRLGVKSTSAVGVYTARENITSARAELIFLQQRQLETMLIIDVLLNQRPGTLKPLESPFPELPPAQIPQIDTPAALLDRRPDIVGSELRLMAANAGIGIAIADLYPDLTISANSGFSSDQLGGLLQSDNAVGSLAGKITAQLFEGGRLRAQIRLRESEARELSWQYAGIVLTAMAEVETALVQERYLRQQVDQRRASTTAARHAETLAQQRYQRGITSLLEVLETQRRRRNAERNFLITQRASWQARVNLHLALGGDWLGVPGTQG